LLLSPFREYNQPQRRDDTGYGSKDISLMSKPTCLAWLSSTQDYMHAKRAGRLSARALSATRSIRAASILNTLGRLAPS